MPESPKRRDYRDYPPQTLSARQARVQLATGLYRGGLSLRQVAVRLNVSYQAVYAMLRRAGVPMRGRGGNQGGHSRHAS